MGKKKSTLEGEDQRRLCHEKASDDDKAQVAPSIRFQLSPQARNYYREPIKVPVLLQVEDKGATGETRDFSPGGVCVILEVPLRAGSPLSLQCSFENICYLNLSGQVVFCLPSHDSQNGKFITGIKFAAIRQCDRDILASVITELKENTLAEARSLLRMSIAKDALALEATEFSLRIARKLSDWPVLPRRDCSYASKIIGWGCYLPLSEISNDEITARFRAPGHKDVGKVIESLTGIKSRRYVKNERYPSDLATVAAQNALNNAEMDAKDLDVIIFFGISRDFHEPATANVVQDKLGAKNAYVYDLANACNGFITAIDTLDAMIESGRCENGLVVSGELISPYIDWQPSTKEDFRLSLFGYTIGDAGGAAVMTRVQPGEKKGIQARWFCSAGSYWDLAVAGELDGANENNKFFKSRGREIEEISYEYMSMGFNVIMDMLGWSMSDLDLVIPHQIPVSILHNTYHKVLGIPLEKLYWTFPRYGNLATASMPVAMCEAIKANRVTSGDKVLLAGGASGFSAGYIALIV